MKAVVNGTTSFASKVSAARLKDVDYNPAARLQLIRDEFDDIGAALTEHSTEFEIRVRYMAEAQTEAEGDNLKGYVGEIVDAIEANRTLSSSYVRWTKIDRTEWSISRDPKGIMFHCYITITIHSTRNTG